MNNIIYNVIADIISKNLTKENIKNYINKVNVYKAKRLITLIIGSYIGTINLISCFKRYTIKYNLLSFKISLLTYLLYFTTIIMLYITLLKIKVED